jgi:hypothetical protein
MPGLFRNFAILGFAQIGQTEGCHLKLSNETANLKEI